MPRRTHTGESGLVFLLFFLSLFLGDGSAFSHVLLVAFQNPGPNDVDVLVLWETEFSSGSGKGQTTNRAGGDSE